MKEVRVLEIKESVFADNDRQADNLRRELKEQGVFLMNLMSSPGSGKTTTLKGTIERLKDRFRIGVALVRQRGKEKQKLMIFAKPLDEHCQVYSLKNKIN